MRGRSKGLSDQELSSPVRVGKYHFDFMPDPIIEGGRFPPRGRERMGQREERGREIERKVRCAIKPRGLHGEVDEGLEVDHKESGGEGRGGGREVEEGGGREEGIPRRRRRGGNLSDLSGELPLPVLLSSTALDTALSQCE